jgi:hypothetical protein
VEIQQRKDRNLQGRRQQSQSPSASVDFEHASG